MTLYLIEDAKWEYGKVVDGCSTHTTVASAAKFRNDNGETGWIYCVHPDRVGQLSDYMKKMFMKKK